METVETAGAIVKREFFVMEGESVTLHGTLPPGNLSLAEWEVVHGGIPELILQYYQESSSVTVYPAFKQRVMFNRYNGSLTLHNVRTTDSGYYRCTFNLLQDMATSTRIRVLRYEDVNVTMCLEEGEAVALECKAQDVGYGEWIKVEEGLNTVMGSCMVMSSVVLSQRTPLYFPMLNISDTGLYVCASGHNNAHFKSVYMVYLNVTAVVPTTPFVYVTNATEFYTTSLPPCDGRRLGMGLIFMWLFSVLLSCVLTSAISYLYTVGAMQCRCQVPCYTLTATADQPSDQSNA